MNNEHDNMGYLEMEVDRKGCEIILRMIASETAVLMVKSQTTGLSEDDRITLQNLDSLKTDVLSLLGLD